MLDRDHYSLRKIQEQDLAQVLAWRNSERIRSVMYTDHIVSWEDHYQWYQKTLIRTDAIHLVFELQGNIIGVANATNIDSYHARCSWGFYLGDTSAPKGSAYVMGLMFLDMLFQQLSIRKVCGEVLALNTDSLKFHRNLWFAEEGHLQEHVLKNGAYADVVLFGLLAQDWQVQRQKTADRLFPKMP